MKGAVRMSHTNDTVNSMTVIRFWEALLADPVSESEVARLIATLLFQSLTVDG